MISKHGLNKIIAVLMAVTMIYGCNLTSILSKPTAAPTLAATTVPNLALTATTAPTGAPALTSTIAPAVTTAPTDTTAPTADQNLANTQAAQTAVANLTLNAPTATPVTPTSTFTTAPTLTQTFTPFPPTATYIPWTSTPTATPIVYSCAVTSTTPSSANTVKVSTAFNWSWVIKNTGKYAWGQHQADIEYVSGTVMQTGGDTYNMPSDVNPGVKVTVTIPMASPSSAGTYTATWQIVQEGAVVCTLPLSVKVTN